MSNTNNPDKIGITCEKCDHNWTIPIESLKPKQITIFRGDDQAKRKVICPKCDHGLIVSVPQEWLNE